MNLPVAPATVTRSFWVFALVSVWTSLGSQVLAFGMAWEAAAQSPSLASAIVAAAVAPRVVLPLLSGVVVDRLGAVQVVIACAAATAVVAVGLAGAADIVLRSPVLLVAAAGALGAISSFTIPALGVMPRLLVAEVALPRALAISQLGQQAANVLGPVLGGVIVASAGLTGTATAEAVGAVAMAAYACCVRGRPTDHPTHADRETLLEQAGGGLTLTARDPVLRSLVVSLACVAGFVLPVTSLLVPILAQDRGWPAQTAGGLAAAMAVGSATVGLAVARTNGAPRPGIAACAGLTIAASSLTALAVVTPPAAALAALAVLGAGVSLYTTHLGPIMLTAAPASHLGRVQAVLLVAQSAPLLVTTVVIGHVADRAGASWSVALCAGGTAVAALVLLSTSRVRGLRSRTA